MGNVVYKNLQLILITLNGLKTCEEVFYFMAVWNLIKGLKNNGKKFAVTLYHIFF